MLSLSIAVLGFFESTDFPYHIQYVEYLRDISVRKFLMGKYHFSKTISYSFKTNAKYGHSITLM